jgi:thioredoxin reductase
VRLGREELQRYDVDCRQERVVDANRSGAGFEVVTAGGTRYEARRLLLTTGVVDVLPNVEGFQELYGRGVYHCPYCDGWEVRDQTLIAYGSGKAGPGLAINLRVWSDRVILCLDGGGVVDDADAQRLEKLGIAVRTERIARLEGQDGYLARVVFEEGPPVDCAALFFATGQHQRSSLAERLGCEFNDKGTVVTDQHEQSNVPGLYLAGDASEDVQFVVVAAAEGAKAAVAINKDLHTEDLPQ